jgi:small nuclear ribonucleoprotein (snRNP)-like protein
MSVAIITKKINARKVTVKLVDGSLVHGKINLHRNDVDINRVSDLFTKVGDPFIVVFDATTEEKPGKVLILNKRNILWIAPEDEPRKAEEPPSEDNKPKDAPGKSLLDRLRPI